MSKRNRLNELMGRRSRLTGDSAPMPQGCTEGASRALALAADEARRFRHAHVGTEHLLLGLAREWDGTAARALGTLGVNPGSLRTALESLLGWGDPEVRIEPRYTPRAMMALDLAKDEARRLHAEVVGTEHLLLAILRIRGMAVSVLGRMGVAPEHARAALLGLLPDAVLARLPGEPDSLTPATRQVLVRAEEEARRLGCGYLGSEHVLLGFLRVPNDPATVAIRRGGAPPAAIRAAAEAVAHRDGAGSGALPLEPELKDVLRQAAVEAGRAHDDLTSTEHLLFGLLFCTLTRDENVAVRALRMAGADIDRILDATVVLMHRRAAVA